MSALTPTVEMKNLANPEADEPAHTSDNAGDNDDHLSTIEEGDEEAEADLTIEEMLKEDENMPVV